MKKLLFVYRYVRGGIPESRIIELSGSLSGVHSYIVSCAVLISALLVSLFFMALSLYKRGAGVQAWTVSFSVYLCLVLAACLVNRRYGKPVAKAVSDYEIRFGSIDRDDLDEVTPLDGA